ncbi:MAG TPA: nicotinate-nucleotide adenylyltransferase [Caulobacteraceae bacterium]|jgi:nicotinate-nucleotide adenylyltransferase
MSITRPGRAPRPAVGGAPEALRLGLHFEPGMRVGLFGGSFNPAHQGHAHVAETALRRLGLDQVIWLASPQNPLKAASVPLETRLTSASGWANARHVVSDAERRLGARYTIDTARRLKRRFPAVRFVWVMGADSLADLHRWRAWPQLLEEIPIAVVARPGSTIRALTSPAARRFASARLPEGAARRLAFLPPPAWVWLTGPWNWTSSTALRALKTRRGGNPDGAS